MDPRVGPEAAFLLPLVASFRSGSSPAAALPLPRLLLLLRRLPAAVQDVATLNDPAVPVAPLLTNVLASPALMADQRVAEGAVAAVAAVHAAASGRPGEVCSRARSWASQCLAHAAAAGPLDARAAPARAHMLAAAGCAPEAAAEALGRAAASSPLRALPGDFDRGAAAVDLVHGEGPPREASLWVLAMAAEEADRGGPEADRARALVSAAVAAGGPSGAQPARLPPRLVARALLAAPEALEREAAAAAARMEEAGWWRHADADRWAAAACDCGRGAGAAVAAHVCYLLREAPGRAARDLAAAAGRLGGLRLAAPWLHSLARARPSPDAAARAAAAEAAHAAALLPQWPAAAGVVVLGSGGGAGRPRADSAAARFLRRAAPATWAVVRGEVGPARDAVLALRDAVWMLDTWPGGFEDKTAIRALRALADEARRRAADTDARRLERELGDLIGRCGQMYPGTSF